MEKLELNQFKDLDITLRGKERFKFIIRCHDSRDLLIKDKSYELVIDKSIKEDDYIDSVTIDIFKDKVELHAFQEGSRIHVSNFTQNEIYELYNKSEIEKLKFAITKAIARWNSYFYD